MEAADALHQGRSLSVRQHPPQQGSTETVVLGVDCFDEAGRKYHIRLARGTERWEVVRSEEELVRSYAEIRGEVFALDELLHLDPAVIGAHVAQVLRSMLEHEATSCHPSFRRLLARDAPAGPYDGEGGSGAARWAETPRRVAPPSLRIRGSRADLLQEGARAPNAAVQDSGSVASSTNGEQEGIGLMLGDFAAGDGSEPPRRADVLLGADAADAADAAVAGKMSAMGHVGAPVDAHRTPGRETAWSGAATSFGVRSHSLDSLFGGRVWSGAGNWVPLRPAEAAAPPGPASAWPRHGHRGLLPTPAATAAEEPAGWAAKAAATSVLETPREAAADAPAPAEAKRVRWHAGVVASPAPAWPSAGGEADQAPPPLPGWRQADAFKRSASTNDVGALGWQAAQPYGLSALDPRSQPQQPHWRTPARRQLQLRSKGDAGEPALAAAATAGAAGLAGRAASAVAATVYSGAAAGQDGGRAASRAAGDGAAVASDGSLPAGPGPGAAAAPWRGRVGTAASEALHSTLSSLSVPSDVAAYAAAAGEGALAAGRDASGRRVDDSPSPPTTPMSGPAAMLSTPAGSAARGASGAAVPRSAAPALAVAPPTPGDNPPRPDRREMRRHRPGSVTSDLDDGSVDEWPAWGGGGPMGGSALLVDAMWRPADTVAAAAAGAGARADAAAAGLSVLAAPWVPPSAVQQQASGSLTPRETDAEARAVSLPRWLVPANRDPSAADERIAHLLALISPTEEARRLRGRATLVAATLVRRALGASAFRVGVTACDAWLPDEDIRCSVFVCRAQEAGWFVKVNELMCRAATDPTLLSDRDLAIASSLHRLALSCDRVAAYESAQAAGDAASHEAAVGAEARGGTQATPPRSPAPGALAASVWTGSAAAAAAAAPSDVDVTRVSFARTASGSSEVSCVVNGVTVTLTVNALDALVATGLVQAVSERVGRGGLFKRSLLLLRAWCMYESAAFTGQSLLRYLPNRALLAVLLRVFIRHGSTLWQPVQVLGLVFREVVVFPWRTHAFTIFGPVPLAAATRPAAADEDATAAADAAASSSPPPYQDGDARGREIASRALHAAACSAHAKALRHKGRDGSHAGGTCGADLLAGKDFGGLVRRYQRARLSRELASGGPAAAAGRRAASHTGQARDEADTPLQSPRSHAALDALRRVDLAHSGWRVPAFPPPGHFVRGTGRGVHPARAGAGLAPAAGGPGRLFAGHAENVPLRRHFQSLASLQWAPPRGPSAAAPDPVPSAVSGAAVPGAPIGGGSSLAFPPGGFPLQGGDSAAADSAMAAQSAWAAMQQSMRASSSAANLRDAGEGPPPGTAPADKQRAEAAVVSLSPLLLAPHSRATRSPIVVLDPFDPSCNVTSAVSTRHARRILHAFRCGAAACKPLFRRMHEAGLVRGGAGALPRNAHTQHLVDAIFPTCWRRFGDGWRPDASLEPLRSGRARELEDLCVGGKLLQALEYGRCLLEQDVTAPTLIAMAAEVLAGKGPLPVGEIGKVLQEATGNTALSSTLKERFGGLKRFLERFPTLFFISQDHPFNPHVYLRPLLTEDRVREIVESKAPPPGSGTSRKRKSAKKKKAAAAVVAAGTHGGTTNAEPEAATSGAPQPQTEATAAAPDIAPRASADPFVPKRPHLR